MLTENIQYTLFMVYTAQINGDVSDAGQTNEQGKIVLLSLWTLETEFHNTVG